MLLIILGSFMKNLLVIAMTLVSVSAFANEHAAKDAHKAAMEACKEHKKDKKAMDACVAEKTKAATTTEAPAAPAPAHK